MTTSTASIDIQLSSAELLYLKDALQIGTIPGGTSADINESEEQVSIWRLAGLNALRARGLVHDNHAEKRIIVDQVLAGILIACSQSRRAVLITSKIAGVQNRMVGLHIADGLTVIHRRERAGIDRFLALLDQSTLAAQLRQELPPGTAEIEPVAAFEITQDVFNQVREAVRAEQIAYATDMLVAAQAPRASAEALLQAMRQQHVHISVVGMDATPEDAQQNRAFYLSLLDTPAGVWVIEFASDGASASVWRGTWEQAYTQIDQILRKVTGITA